MINYSKNIGIDQKKTFESITNKKRFENGWANKPSENIKMAIKIRHCHLAEWLELEIYIKNRYSLPNKN